MMDVNFETLDMELEYGIAMIGSTFKNSHNKTLKIKEH